MRSNLITVVTAVASILLVGQVAAADPVQEQLRLMEQRMAEMEDRLAATSEELKTTKATAAEQQDLMTEAGLIETDENGMRSAVGSFLQQVEVSGNVAASYNYRFVDGDDDQLLGANRGGNGSTLFRHPDSNTFALDQVWLSVDKPATEESRAGFHADYVYGKTAQSQGAGSRTPGTTNDYDSSGLLYTGYLSYLAPIGSGVLIDAGKIATPLGAETIKASDNFNITQGLVFGLQPVNHVGIQAATALTDSVGLTVGIVNDVYTSNNFDLENGKAYYAQLAYGGDAFGASVGAIVGNDIGAGCGDADDDCYTSVLDVVLSADPTENLSVWANFDWVRTFGGRNPRGRTATNGDAFGASFAGRLAITETTGFATRVEYVRADNDFNDTGVTSQLSEIVSLTGTIDQQLTDGLKLRVEARWDTSLDNTDGIFVNGNNGPGNGGFSVSPTRDDQVVGLAELLYEF